MFAGKTTKLMQTLRRFHLQGESVLLVKWDKDTRTNGMDEKKASPLKVVSHDGWMFPSIAVANLKDARIPDSVSVIGIDEGQFFGDLPGFCSEQADTHRRTVIVSALSTDANRRVFDGVATTIALADDHEIVPGVCALCQDLSIYTKRIVAIADGDGPLIAVGGDEAYYAVCRGCWHVQISDASDVRLSPHRERVSSLPSLLGESIST